MRIISTAVLGLFVATLSPAFAGESNQSEQLARIKCQRSVPVESAVLVESTADGDTISVRAKAGVYAVRLIGIDTPETHFRGESQGEWGDAAAERIAEMLPPGKKVRLEFGPNVCDMYGRVLAHVFAGKTHVNKQLVKEGLAVNYCLFPSLSHCEELGLLTDSAMQERIGMFSDPKMELPYDFRRRIKGTPQTSFVGNLSTKKVYRPGKQNKVPVAERIFFYGQSNIKAPFQLVE